MLLEKQKEEKMNNKSKVFCIVAFMILLGVFFSSGLRFEDADAFVKETVLGMQTETVYTDRTETKIYHDNYLHSQNQEEAFWVQKSEQRENVQRVSFVLLALLTFSLEIYPERVYLSYIKFNLFSFARFLCEYFILLEKDGKKRNPAFILA